MTPATEQALAPAQPINVLTLQSVLHHTYMNNPTLRAAREELRATHEFLPQAQAGYKPSIIAATNVTRSDSDGSSFGSDGASTEKNFGITLDQPLYRGGRTMAESTAARYTIGAQSDLLNQSEQLVLLDAATAYMNVVRDAALLDLSQNNEEVIAKSLQVTTARFDAGELTKTDTSQAKARLARAKSEIIRARGNLNTSIGIFNQVTGLPAENLVEPVLDLPLPATLDDATAQAETGSPLVLASQSTHKAAEADISGEFGALLPEVGFFTSYDKSYDPRPNLNESSSNAIGISASIPLYEAGVTRSRVRQAKHVANQRYLEILETKRQARQETVSSWESLAATNAEITSRASEVEAARVAREGVRQETEIGTRTVLDALDADQELLNAEVALVTARTDRIIAQFRLLSSLGMLTPSTLGFADNEITHGKNLEEARRKIFSTDVDRVTPDP
ncbi:MAG: TolC family outer membrane protein [Alphaproteobacteria bacterium]